MIYEDISRHYDLHETEYYYKEMNITRELLQKYYKKVSGKNLIYPNSGNILEDFLYLYFMIKDTENEKIMNEILKSYNFNYSESILNSIYHLLEIKNKKASSNPLLWPGINTITRKDKTYTINTVLGTIRVNQASKIFSNTKSSHIFRKQLSGKCFQRTYEFLKENQDYQAVISYMPNFFVGGHYHAYLEKEETVLDIAGNAFYDSKDEASKVLCGKIITKLTYEQVEDTFKKLKKEIPEVSKKKKLLTIGLYHDIKNNSL